MKQYLILFGIFLALSACTKPQNRLGATSIMPDEYKVSKDHILETPPQLRNTE
ncbi:MAG: hypothetical protein H6909_03025 [Rickettsiaceae bacterium]|nr:hypothetical protein [Rickettsiaceae bacterium]